MFRRLIRAGVEIPVRTGVKMSRTGYRAAGIAVDVARTGRENAGDIVELGRTALHQAPLLARLCRILTESPEATARLIQATGQNAETMVELLESTLKNPRLLTFMKEMGDDPDRLNKLLKMGDTVSRQAFPEELTEYASQNADTLVELMGLLEKNPRLVEFLKDTGNNPAQINRLMDMAEQVVQGASPLKLYKAWRGR